MSRPFIHDNFLLTCPQAEELYHTYAKEIPIIDFHCHLNPALIAQNDRFDHLTHAWLDGDHYKWRQMRTNGVDERFCTGEAEPYEKFEAWAGTVPHTLCNPLYHWTHLELTRYFGITDLLNPNTAQDIWRQANEQLGRDSHTIRSLLTSMKVEVVATTDDPTDKLTWHAALAQDDTCSIRVIPTFRPDKAMAIDDPESWLRWIETLELVTGSAVTSFDTLIAALRERHDFFHSLGCRASDHGIDTVYATPYLDSQVRATFLYLREGKTPTAEEVERFKSAILYECARMDAEKGWVQQLHIGALRNNNTRAFRNLGPDTGFDSIDDALFGRALSRFLDRLDQEERLPKTIIYNLNPRDFELCATMLGNFQDGSIPGKLQLGSGWWFLDQKSGIEKQLDALGNLSLLSRFVGMLTDSRSFLSFPRHEYFRRVLCNFLGTRMASGELPDEPTLVGEMAGRICNANAREYFGF